MLSNQTRSKTYTYYIKLILLLFIFDIFIQLFKIWCKCTPVFLRKRDKIQGNYKCCMINLNE